MLSLLCRRQRNQPPEEKCLYLNHECLWVNMGFSIYFFVIYILTDLQDTISFPMLHQPTILLPSSSQYASWQYALPPPPVSLPVAVRHLHFSTDSWLWQVFLRFGPHCLWGLTKFKVSDYAPILRRLCDACRSHHFTYAATYSLPSCPYPDGENAFSWNWYSLFQRRQ